MTVSPGNGMTYPSVPQLLDSAAYWWSKDRVMATDVLMITTYASETTERGQLQIAEDCTKFMSFLLSWAMSWGFKPSGDDEDDTPPKDGSQTSASCIRHSFNPFSPCASCMNFLCRLIGPRALRQVQGPELVSQFHRD